MIAREIITVPNLLEAILRGPKADKLFQLITREVQRSIDLQASVVKPFVAVAVGTRRFQEMKQTAATKAAERIPETVRHAEAYAVNALDVRNTIVDRMRLLSPLESMERDAIVQSLLDSGGNKVKAAEALGMSRATIYRKIHEYGIVTPLS